MQTATAKRPHPMAKRTVGHIHVEPTITEPQLDFCLPEEIKHLCGEEPAGRSGRNAKTLVKHPDFRIVLIVMKKGARMQEHQAAGRISIQTIGGQIRIHLGEQHIDLSSGHLLVLDRAEPHDVEALQDSAFLLTLAWNPKR